MDPLVQVARPASRQETVRLAPPREAWMSPFVVQVSVVAAAGSPKQYPFEQVNGEEHRLVAA